MADLEDAKANAALVEYHADHPEQRREKMTVKQYLRSRWTELKPPMVVPPNPISLMRLLNGRQWNFFLVRDRYFSLGKETTHLTVTLGCLRRLDLGCFRFLLRQPHHYTALKRL